MQTAKNKTMIQLIIILTILACGLIAGLFYSYSCSINPGLKNLSDTGYLQSMQQINRAILNPVFFASFMGTLILLPLSTWLGHGYFSSTQFYYFLAATIIYVVLTFGVTIAGNVPLNEALDRFDINSATTEQIQQHRQQFESKWNQLHLIRTLASVSSFLLTILGTIQKFK